MTKIRTIEDNWLMVLKLSTCGLWATLVLIPCVLRSSCQGAYSIVVYLMADRKQIEEAFEEKIVFKDMVPVT